MTKETHNKDAAADGARGMNELKGFLNALPDEMRNDEDLAHFADVVELARGYLKARDEARRLKSSAPERPRGADEYEIPVPGDLPVDGGLVDGFRALAFEMGLSPEQARGIAQFWNAFARERMREEERGQLEALENLRNEWGGDFDRRVKEAAKAAARFGGDGFRVYLDETGMGNDPRFIRAFHAIAEAIGEDSYQRGGSGPGKVRRGAGGMPLLRFRSMEGSGS